MNIRKRNNVWEYRFDIATEGKRRQISKSGFKKKRDCELAGLAALSYYENGGTVSNMENITFSGLLDLWLASNSQNWKPATETLYKKIIELKLKPALGSFRVRSLTPLKIQTFINDVYMKESASYAKLICIVLKGSLKYAVVPLGVRSSSPAEYVKIPRANSKKKHYEIIDPERLQEILPQIPEPYAMAVLISYFTGCRLGEVFALSWADIDFNDKIINVNKNLSYSLKSWRILTPKTQSSIRSVSVPDVLLRRLEAFKREQLKNKILYGEFYITNYIDNDVLNYESGTVSNLVLREKNGAFAKPSTMERLCRENGFRFHWLRHTHATSLIEAGINPKIVQERLGHSNISITLQTYVHPDKDSHRAAAATFDKIPFNF